MNTVGRIKKLAKEQGRSLTYLCKELGYSSRTYFNDIEKNNRNIPRDKLNILAEILGVSVEYLLGETDEYSANTNSSHKIISTYGTEASNINLTKHETSVIDAYRAQPELQPAVDKLLGVEADNYVTLYSAAHSEDNKPDTVVRKRKADWEKIKRAPETDDKLI